MKDDLSGARASNAGDDFHFLWAGKRALKLLEPNTEFKALCVEGSSEEEREFDNEKEVLYSIDISEYYGGDSFYNSTSVVFSQLKYSTAYGNKDWTWSELITSSNKAKNNSIIQRLAKTYSGYKGKFPNEIDKLTIKLISNKGIDINLINSLESAKEWIHKNKITKYIEIKNLCNEVESNHIKKLYDSSKLSSNEFVGFIKALDFSECGAGIREIQEVEVIKSLDKIGVSDLKTGKETVIEFIRKQMLPEAKKSTPITKYMVTNLFSSLPDALFPVPSKLINPVEFVKRDISVDIANKLLQSKKKYYCLHATGGIGKTTVVLNLQDELPDKSIVLIYDCFSGGGYMNAESAVHTYKNAITQLSNDLAMKCSTPFLVDNRNKDDSEYLKNFSERIKIASKYLSKLNTEAILVIVLDAIDNSYKAANFFGEKCFAEKLLHIGLPENVRFLVTCRTEKIEYCKLPNDIEKIKLDGFNQKEQCLYVEKFYNENISIEQCEEIRKLTDGNPRVQNYVFTRANNGINQAIKYLKPNGKNLFGIFREALEKVQEKVESEELSFKELCRALVELPRPIPVDVITAATSYNCEKLASVCSEYLIGLYYHNGEITFRDEDFETYLRETVKDGDTVVSKIAEILFSIRKTSYYANKYMHLFMIRDENIDMLLDSIYKIRDIEISILENEINYILSKRIEAALNLNIILDKKYREDVIKLLYIKTKCTEKDSSIKELIKNNLELASSLNFDNIIESSLLGRDNCSFLSNLTFQCYRNTLLGKVDAAEEYFKLSKSKIGLILDTNNSKKHSRDNIKAKDIEYIAAYSAINISVESSIQWLNGWKPMCVREAYNVTYLLLLKDMEDDAEEFIYKATNIDMIAASMAAFIDYNKTIKSEYISRVIELIGSVKESKSQNSYKIVLAEYLLKIGMKKEAKLIIENVQIRLDSTIFSFDERDERLEVGYIFRMYILKCLLDEKKFSFEEFWIYNQLDETSNSKYKRERYEEVERVVNFIIESFKLRVRHICGDDNSKPKFEDFKREYEELERGIYQFYNDHNSYSYYKVKCINIIPILLKENRTIVREYCDKFLNNKYLNYDFHFSFVKLLISSSKHNDLAPWYVYKLEEKEKRNPMDSITLRDFYVKCSKALYLFEKQLSKDYFKKALESTNLVDYDIYHRMNLWENISEKYKSDKNSPALVYNFTRIIEDAYKRLDDSKHLPQESIFKLLTRIEPSAAIASACRLEDRDQYRVLGFENSIPIILSELLDKSIIKPELAIATSNSDIEYGIKYDNILKSVLDRLNSNNENIESIIKVITEDIEKLSSGYSSKLEVSILDEWNRKYSNSDIEKLSEKYKYISKSNSIDLSPTQESTEQYTPWNNVDKEVINYDKDGIEILLRKIAYNEKIKAIEYIIHNSKYVEKVKVIKSLIELVYSSKVTVELKKFNKLLLEYIIETREYHPELRVWFSDESNLEWFIELYYDKSYINESYIKEISDMFILDENIVISKLIRIVSKYFKKEDWKIYYIIRDLSKLYDEKECSSLLNWCCDEEITNVHENSTDEVYSSSLEDKFTIEEAIAIYIIKMLGHTNKKNRWYAVHSIYNLSRMNNSIIIENIFKFIWSDIPRVFRDKSYIFFKDSAITYYLIALRRIAVDNIIIIKKFIPRLLEIAKTNEVINILHRVIAKEIVEKIYSEDIGIKTCCNVVKKEKIKSNKYNYNRRNKIATKYKFDFMDVVPYEYEILGDVFGKSSDEVAKDCDDIIASWKLSNNDVDKWNELYRSREIQQGSYGYNTSIEDLDKYIQYNAMFYVADLYRTNESEVKSYYGDEENFEEWLYNWLPNNDGYWLYEVKLAPPNISQFLDTIKYVSDEKYYIEDRVFDNIIFYKEEEEYVILDAISRINYHQSDKRYNINVGVMSIDNLPRLQEESNNINYFIQHNFGDVEDDEVPGLIESIIDDCDDMQSKIEKYDPYIKGLNTYNIKINNKLEKFLKLDDIRPIKYCLSKAEDYPIKVMYWGYEDKDRLYNLESNGRVLMIKKKELIKYLETRKDTVIVFQVDIGFSDSYNCHNKSKAKDRRKIFVMNNNLTDTIMELEVKIIDKYL